MKSFSELTSASQVNNGDLLAISQTSGNSYASKKTTVKDITDKSNLNLAEEYDSTSTYAVDDYVIYESVLYKCISTTTGTFDSTKWTSVVVTDEMGSGGGGGTGGHTIIDENGNSMTARAGLQFVGAKVSDDATNNKTIVDMSGGGVYIEKTLWEDVNGLQFAPNNIQTITLSESLNKYDFIYVDISSVADSGYHNQNILAVSSLYNENDGYNGVVCIGGNINLATSFAKVDNTHLKFIGFSSANPLIVWKVVGIKVSGDYYAPVIYSTEEREIGVWKDGKPLYQKTLVVDNVGTVTSSSQNTCIVVNDIPFDYVQVVTSSIFDNSSDQRRYPLPNTPRGNANGIFYHTYLDKDSSPVIFYVSLYTNSGTYSNLTDLEFTIQYTKTTDVAGSGSWTPQGVPAVHYSTDEQVIGTWIDGSTLYEKTIEFGALPNNTTKTVAYNISNLNNIVDVKGIAYNQNGARPLPFVDDAYKTGDVLLDTIKSSGVVRIIAHDDLSSLAGYVTLRYTKTS